MRAGNKRQRLELFRTFRFGNRFVKTLDCYEIRAVPLVRGRIRGLELDRFLKLTLSRGTIPIPAKLDKRHRRVRFRRALIDFERASRSFFRFRKSLFWLQSTVN